MILGSCFPTLGAKTKTRQGWGTRQLSVFMAAPKSKCRSFDSFAFSELAQDDKLLRLRFLFTTYAVRALQEQK
jgi:hypothetical protein